MTHRTTGIFHSIVAEKENYRTSVEYNKLMSLLDYPESRSAALETLVHQASKSGYEEVQMQAMAALATQVELPKYILDQITALVYQESNLNVQMAVIELLSGHGSHVRIAFHILKDMIHDGLSRDEGYMLSGLYKKMKMQYFSDQRELALL
ncbi:MAG: hypothetical protein U0518_02265 [Candidatus Gracilibacteria bacterium]